jgi:hypothetical protein
MHCRKLGIRLPRNKYTDVAAFYLSYYKKRKRKRTVKLSAATVLYFQFERRAGTDSLQELCGGWAGGESDDWGCT